MALTRFQRELLHLLARNRIENGESYVAGGVALNTVISADRLSRDVDLFHDSAEAVSRAFDADRQSLEDAGCKVEVEVHRKSYVEAFVRRDHESCLFQWTQDSAFRFFPLMEHAELGLTLHPFDLATNKVLALVGRAEPRDWVDVIECDIRLQPLGFLAWAAAGKDPGLSPTAIIEYGARTRYTEIELAEVDFGERRPSVPELARKWRSMIATAREVVAALPPAEVGACVLDSSDQLLRCTPEELKSRLAAGDVRFHHGTLRGAFPTSIL